MQTDAGIVEKPIPHGFKRMYDLLKKHQPGNDMLKIACRVNREALRRSTPKQGLGTVLFKGGKRVRSQETQREYHKTSTDISETIEPLGSMGESVMAYKNAK